MCHGATTYWVINMLSKKITRQHDKNSTLQTSIDKTELSNNTQ